MTGSVALVTGASSGLGVEFARALARRKNGLVLVARRREPMERLAEELREREGVEVVVEPMDLTERGSAAALAQRLGERGMMPDILVNNAAFGMSGRFVEQAPERIREMLELDVVSVVELTQVFARRMLERGGGRIALVASLAAYQPNPLLAAYGAAKSFVLRFGEALHVELGPRVGVTVISPGLMETEFFEVSGFRPKEVLKRGMMRASDVAEAGVRAMERGRSSVVVGRLNRVSAMASKLLPGRLAARLVYRMSKD